MAISLIATYNIGVSIRVPSVYRQMQFFS